MKITKYLEVNYMVMIMTKEIHLKRVLATSWNDEEDHSKGIEQFEHLFVSVDKELWQEINHKLLFKDITIDDYKEAKELLDKLSITIGKYFFQYKSNVFIHYKNKKIPKIKILEETTIK